VIALKWYREVTRKFAYHGYAALSPNLYARAGHGTPEDVAAAVRGTGGVPDELCWRRPKQVAIWRVNQGPDRAIILKRAR